MKPLLGHFLRLAKKYIIFFNLLSCLQRALACFLEVGRNGTSFAGVEFNCLYSGSATCSDWRWEVGNVMDYARTENDH